MASTVFNLVNRYAIERGLPWQLRFTRKAGKGRTPVDLTGCTARIELFDALDDSVPPVLFSTETGHITLGGESGTVVCVIPGGETLALNMTHGRYRFYFIDSLGVESLYLRGRLALLDVKE